MRRIAAVLILTLVAISLLVVTLLAHRQEAELAVTVYDPNSTHIWNRLHSALFVRDDIRATRFFPDPLDAPYWDRTSYLLDQPSHHRMFSAQNRGANLGHQAGAITNTGMCTAFHA